MFRFVKMMITENKTYIDECKTMSQIHVYNELIKNMDENQLWFSNSTSRIKICNSLNLSDGRVKAIVKELTDLGLLHKKMKGIYLISKVFVSTIKE
jgi:hypothetical protein